MNISCNFAIAKFVWIKEKQRKKQRKKIIELFQDYFFSSLSVVENLKKYITLKEEKRQRNETKHNEISMSIMRIIVKADNKKVKQYKNERGRVGRFALWGFLGGISMGLGQGKS